MTHQNHQTNPANSLSAGVKRVCSARFDLKELLVGEETIRLLSARTPQGIFWHLVSTEIGAIIGIQQQDDASLTLYVVHHKT